MAKHTRGENLRSSLIKEFHLAGHDLNRLADKLKIDVTTTGIMLDQALSGRVPITGKENQERLGDAIRHKDEIGKGNRGEMSEVNRHVGEDFTLKWYKGEVGKTLPSEAIENASRVRVIGHISGAGKEHGDFISTSFFSDIAGAMGAFGYAVSEYEDDDIDDIEIETFEYNGEE